MFKEVYHVFRRVKGSQFLTNRELLECQGGSCLQGYKRQPPFHFLAGVQVGRQRQQLSRGLLSLVSGKTRDQDTKKASCIQDGEAQGLPFQNRCRLGYFIGPPGPPISCIGPVGTPTPGSSCCFFLESLETRSSLLRGPDLVFPDAHALLTALLL